MRPNFDLNVPRDGYAWWYVDAISDDGRHGLTMIAFIGSVFSPYYAWARARGHGDPLDFCAINVALYGSGGRWCMTERGRSAMTRTADTLNIGPSRLRWSEDALAIEVREWAVPLPRPLRGRIHVQPQTVNHRRLDLDGQGRHHWSPIWPAARVELDFEQPGLNWSGSGYFDHNAGSEPLERGFNHWSWSRAMTKQGPVVLYDTQLRSGQDHSHALLFERSGDWTRLPSPERVKLPRSRWGIARPTRSEDGAARVISTWEDTPFYARSLVDIGLLGERVTAVHEGLSLKRFSSRVVQLMLPFRMPRKA